MYRIKTDIRQYKCESIDKVEKLIRNWVIRPNDLIYHSDARDWLPIGQHPSFQKLFGILEEREAAEPDTVVTQDHPLRNGREVGESEVTQMTERPDFDDSEAGDDESDPEETAAPGLSDASDALDSRETDIFDADQIADSLAERDRADDPDNDELDATDEPSSDDPEEEVAADDEPDDESASVDDFDENDETNENLDEAAAKALAPAEDDGEDAKPAPPVAPEGVEPPVNDEITVMTDKTLEMLKVDEDPDDVVSDDEATQVAERPTDPEEEEATQVTERPTGPDEADEEATSDEHEVLVAAPDDDAQNAAKPKGVGRHDLPEEFFATNEISGPVFEESARVIDDLAAMEEARQSAGNEVDDGWDAIEEEMEDAPSPLGLRDTDELAVPETDAGKDDEATPSDDGDEKAVAAADEWDEEVSQLESEDTSPGVAPIEEFISDGYKIPLPFPIGPDEKDVALGLKLSKKSKAAKDACFPYPKPKNRGEVHARVYYFSKDEPRDLSVPIVVFLVVAFLLIATTLALC